MLALILAVLGAAATPTDARTTVALAPPLSTDGAETWIGVSLADNLTTRLLIHSRLDPKSMQRVYPLNVFGWRQTVSAARNEGLDGRTTWTPVQAHSVLQQLGADCLFVASYKPAPKGVELNWQLLGSPASKPQTVTVLLDKLSDAAEDMAAGVLTLLQQDPGKTGGHPLQGLPLAAMRPLGLGLEIVAKQSLDPRARIVVAAADLEQAHLYFTAATDAAPEFSRAWVERGIVSTMQGQFARAEDEFVQAMATSGEFEPANALGLFYLYDRQHKGAEATEVLEKATTTHLGFLQGLGYLGEAYLHADRPHDAVQVFSAYHNRVPKSLWARIMRGAALSAMGNHAEAVSETEAVLKDSPDSTLALNALASRQVEAKLWAPARLTLNKALGKQPDQPLLLNHLATVELADGHPDKAAAAAAKALAAVKTGRGEGLEAAIYLNLAQALGLQQQAEPACMALNKARGLGATTTDVQAVQQDARLKEVWAAPGCGKAR